MRVTFTQHKTDLLYVLLKIILRTLHQSLASSSISEYAKSDSSMNELIINVYYDAKKEPFTKYLWSRMCTIADYS